LEEGRGGIVTGTEKEHNQMKKHVKSSVEKRNFEGASGRNQFLFLPSPTRTRRDHFWQERPKMTRKRKEWEEHERELPFGGGQNKRNIEKESHQRGTWKGTSCRIPF
jgi:hypothetical protein